MKGAGRPSHREDYFTRMTDWMERWLADPSEERASSAAVALAAG